MNILTILATIVVLAFSYIYVFRWRKANKVKKREFDFTGNSHRFIDIGENIVDHCAVGLP